MVDNRYRKVAICGICKSLCGIEVTIENNKVIAVEGDKNNPLTKGYICPRGKALPEIMYSKERLSQPIKKNADGSWRNISWVSGYTLMIMRIFMRTNGVSS